MDNAYHKLWLDYKPSIRYLWNNNIKYMDIMRRNLYALLVMIVLMSCTGKTNYVINGHSSDFADGNKVYLLYLDANEEPVFIDSTVCRNNSFVFRGSADTARVATVAVVDTLEDDSAISINLVLEPGNISIEGFDPETNHFHVATGTPLNDLLDRFSRKVGAYVNNPDSLFPFIAFVGGFLFDRYHYSMPWQMKLDLINSMSAGQKASYAAISKGTLMRIEQEKERAAKARELFPGNLYKDFTGKSPSDEDVSLKSVVGDNSNTYVLLIFWATWCAPCRADMPIIADLYNQYRDKGFEVFAASIDDNHTAWLDVVKNYPQWRNVIVGDDIRDMYGVKGVPAHFLIDCSTGKILIADTWSHHTLDWRDGIVNLFEKGKQ